MLYRLLDDTNNFLTLTFDLEEVLEKFGEDNLMPLDPTPRKFLNEWQKIKVLFVHDGSGKKDKPEPDISFNSGHIFLSKKAKAALSAQLTELGELLEVEYGNRTGFIFNPLKIQPVNPKKSTKHPVGDYPTNISFDKEYFIFRTDFDGYYGVFVDQDFKRIVEENGLTGIIFEPDLSHIFDRSADSCKPSNH